MRESSAMALPMRVLALFGLWGAFVFKIIFDTGCKYVRLVPFLRYMYVSGHHAMSVCPTQSY